MIKKRLRILSVVIVILAFFKIYKHNLLVQLTYEHQRLVHNKKRLEQVRNELYINYLRMHDPDKIFTYAKKKLGMQALAIDQIRHIPVGMDAFDCLHSTSHDTVLKIIGLYDFVVGKTGGVVHVRT